jgi:DNA repair exonuclease SbcCD ATPase subunit
MLTLNENPAEKLASDLWESWRHDGINPRNKTYLEIKRLADHFLKICRDQEIDYKEHDFNMMVDSNLNYYENKAEIENALNGTTEAVEEAEAFSELNDKLKEDYGITVTKSLKPVTELEEKNKDLAATNKRLKTMLEEAEAKKHQEIPISLEPYKPVNVQFETIQIIIPEMPPFKLREQPIKKSTAKTMWEILSLCAWLIRH